MHNTAAIVRGWVCGVHRAANLIRYIITICNGEMSKFDKDSARNAVVPVVVIV